MIEPEIRLSLAPWMCLPPHRITHPEKLQDLISSMEIKGWSGRPLVGYPVEGGKIQLLSGSHRWAAAAATGIPIPITMYARSAVESAWGNLDAWRQIMES